MLTARSVGGQRLRPGNFVGDGGLRSGKLTRALGLLGFALLLGPNAGVERRASLLHMLQALLDASDLGASRIHCRLTRTELIGGANLRLPQSLDIGFERAHLRHLCLNRGLGGGGLDLSGPCLLAGQIRPQTHQRGLHRLQLGRQIAIALSGSGLCGQTGDLLIEPAQDVLDAVEVDAGVAQPALGFLPALAVARHAGGFFEEVAQLLGTRLDNAVDHALLDDAVGAGAHASAQKQVANITLAHREVVDEELRVTVALEHPTHRNLGKRLPLPGRPSLAVVEQQFHRRARHRFAPARAVENDVLQRLAAQPAGRRLAEHPAHCIDDVGLAAAIGPDHAHQLSGHRNRHGIDEALEAGELDLGQAHGGQVRRMIGQATAEVGRRG